MVNLSKSMCAQNRNKRTTATRNVKKFVASTVANLFFLAKTSNLWVKLTINLYYDTNGEISEEIHEF